MFAKLPIEIVREHILPYTYKVAPPKVLEDIRNFTPSLEEFIRVCEEKGIRRTMIWYELHMRITYDPYSFLPTTTNTHENVPLLTDLNIALYSRQFRIWEENIKITIERIDSLYEENYGTFLLRFWWGLMTVQERQNFIQRTIDSPLTVWLI